jgi:signal transduction histidine kinase
MLPSQPSSRRTLLVVTFATLGGFGLLVAGLSLRLRGQLRAEVLQREAEAIHAVALMELNSPPPGTRDLAATDPMPALFAAVLESSRLRGVMAVQLFDANGRFQMALPDTGAESLAPRWWALDLPRPAARFHRDGSLEAVLGAEVDPGAAPTRVPLLEIVVPLRLTPKSPAPDGVARYWIDGTSVAAEFARMDRGLAGQAGLAYGGTSLLVAAVLAWAFRRLAESNRRLVAQSADLARANQELDFAAKTGAIGAISAHLIHGLNNPLAGLEGFVADAALAPDAPQGEAWQAAVDTTRRLRAMVQEVMTVLRDEAEGRADYPVPLAEFLASVHHRSHAAAESAGVELKIAGPAEGELLARTVNLGRLVLANLVANAIEASPRGAVVSLTTRVTDRGLEILVADAGSGLPAAVRATLFQPVKSGKRNGGGVGLVISRALAHHAAGELELVRSDPAGTVFCLRVPLLAAPPRRI